MQHGSARRLVRQRLLIQLDAVWQSGVATVVAPAGSGKTTLLEQWAAGAGAPVAWLTADAAESSSGAFVRAVGRALSHALDRVLTPESVEGLVAEFARCTGRLAVIVDDVHKILGTEAETVLEHVIDAAPKGAAVLLASRREPALRLSRRRLDESLLELGSEELRFRSWETESLFRRHYAIPIAPEEAARLTSRTQGWAAGIKLFHLAVRDKPRTERVRLLEEFGGGSRVVSDYLADNVMLDLPPEVAEFMVLTSPLGVLDGELCDEYLGRSGSADVLAEVERRELFLLRSAYGGPYCYHEILRTYLDGLLSARVGEPETKAMHYRAARLLLGRCHTEGERTGEPGSLFEGAAVRALCRAGSWKEAGAFLASRADRLTGSTADLIERIPDAVFDSDPWLKLAQARRHLASGDLRAALASYGRCEGALPQRMGAVARGERLAVANWLSPLASPAPGWVFALRRALSADPLSQCPAAEDGTVEDLACAALVHLVAGLAEQARDLFEKAALKVTDPTWDLAIRLGHTASCMLAMTEPNERYLAARRCLALAAEADRLGLPWLNRQAHCLLALAGETELAAEARLRCRADGDQWGEVLAGILEGAGRLLSGEAPLDLLGETIGLARSLGAGVFEAIAHAEMAAALAAAEYPEAHDAAVSAEALARRAGVPGAQALCHVALASVGSERADHAHHARLLAEDCGLGILRPPAEVAGSAARRPKPDPGAEEEDLTLRLQCFGGLLARRDGALVDHSSLRPRVRALLAILALNHPDPVHVDVVIEQLWPDTDYEAATHRMQTAVSSLRRALERGSAERGPAVQRRGSAYFLDGAHTDIEDFHGALRAAASARASGDRDEEASALRRALLVHRGDLLSEFGPAEWLVRERERLGLLAANAAEHLAVMELDAGNASAAVAIAVRGIGWDRYRESLWQVVDEATGAGAEGAAGDALRALHDRTRSAQPI